MSTHTGRALLNSCIKVPIDPCNNCPAPTYNRPKLCMDYCEVKHLHKADFYSTLESLRSTSRELRALPTPQTTIQPKERCASASASSTSCKGKQRNGKGKKAKKKQSSQCLAPSIMPLPLPLPISPPTHCPAVPDITPSSRCLSEEYDKCLRDLGRLKNFKEDFALEVADFKRSLKNFELEFKSKGERPKSTSSSGTQTTNVTKQTPATQPKTPAMHTAERAKCRRELLRRCYSVNDLGLTTPTPATTPRPPTAVQLPKHSLSSYFSVKDAPLDGNDVPKINIESPSISSKRSGSGSATSGSSRLRRRRTRKVKLAATKTEEEQPVQLLSIFELEQLPKRTASVSPQHPVARPNLAATLRAEVSRKKVKELQNNCTYHDPRPAFDWEVRKTPAWKSLSLNESHKALLSIRLATRKAEQALQERQYDLHMQMMRQRVKSAPLLLEGPTFWGPEVGKLSHSCGSEGLQHACESNQQRSHKSRRSKCSGSRCATAAAESDSKLQQLRKIYGSSLRQSHRSSSRRRETEQQTPDPEHDSADELCSMDRAFL
ncbi:CG1113 [Drosophila busckii]|uniref:CG1113 n=1 Tax=Drosophila busckii TaxID=30019 RepID=A0A0M4EP97_DROBS|nr:CG1113 [Drosophila busckii]